MGGKRGGKLVKDVLFLQNNASAHKLMILLQKIDEIGWNVWPPALFSTVSLLFVPQAQKNILKVKYFRQMTMSYYSRLRITLGST